MRRRIAIALVLAGGVAAAAVVVVSRGDAAASAVPSYTRTVAPLIAEKCAGCHRLGGIAPFRLDTAASAKKHAALIAAAVSGTRDAALAAWACVACLRRAGRAHPDGRPARGDRRVGARGRPGRRARAADASGHDPRCHERVRRRSSCRSRPRTRRRRRAERPTTTAASCSTPGSRPTPSSRPRGSSPAPPGSCTTSSSSASIPAQVGEAQRLDRAGSGLAGPASAAPGSPSRAPS